MINDDYGRASYGVAIPAGTSEERRADVLGRVALGDIEGLSSLLNIPNKEALRLTVADREAGTSERKVLRTPDARRIKRDLLNVIAAEASSKLAKRSILLLAPTLDRGKIESRFELYAKGRGVFDALSTSRRLEKMKSHLSRLDLVHPSPTSPRKEGARRGAAAAAPTPLGERSETLEFFSARRQMVDTINHVLREFADVAPVVSFLGATDPKMLQDVLGSLEDAGSASIQDAEAVISDAALEINDALRGNRGSRDRERVLSLVEEKLGEISSILRLKVEEEEMLRRAALQNLSVPFDFDRTETKRLVSSWTSRKEEEQRTKLRKVEGVLKAKIPAVEALIERAVLLDQLLAIASAASRYGLIVPSIGTGGVGFVNAKNLLLLASSMARQPPQEDKGPQRLLQPVTYVLGRTESIAKVAKSRNTAILTGANSGGKTTLLNTVASIHILALLGLPVPAEQAEVTPMPVYLFRKKVARRSGSLEQTLRSLIPLLAERQRKLVLIDELEALTEPGAAGRIIAAIINKAATTSSLFLLVTHLAKETLPYVRLPVRVDGIEASGLDENGDLVVDRQPVFEHIGSSTPKLIVMKLAKSARKESIKEVYDEVLASLESEGGSAPIQAPIAFPWAEGVE